MVAKPLYSIKRDIKLDCKSINKEKKRYMKKKSDVDKLFR